MGPKAEFDAIGSPVNDTDLAIIDAERLGTNLSHDGLEALADGCAAGDDLDVAGDVDVDLGPVERSEPALLDEEAEPRADEFPGGPPCRQCSLEIVPAESRQRLLEQAEIIARVVGDVVTQHGQRPRIRHGGGRDEVASAHVDGRHVETRGNRVEQTARGRNSPRSGPGAR